MPMYARVQVAKDFPARLEIARRLHGLTLKRLADDVGVVPSTIWRWLRGNGGPNELAIVRIAEKLGDATANYLTGKSNKPPTLVVKS